jgi:hypothetical protein
MSNLRTRAAAATLLILRIKTAHKTRRGKKLAKKWEVRMPVNSIGCHPQHRPCRLFVSYCKSEFELVELWTERRCVIGETRVQTSARSNFFSESMALSLRKLPRGWEVRGQCICKELPVIPVKGWRPQKELSEKNGGRRRRRGIWGSWPPKNVCECLGRFIRPSQLL